MPVEERLVVGRKTTDPDTLGPTLPTLEHDLARPARLRRLNRTAEAAQIVVRFAVAGRKDALVVVVGQSRLRVADDGKDRRGHRAIGKIGDFQPRLSRVVESQSRLAVQALGFIPGEKVGRRLGGMPPFSALVFPGADSTIHFLVNCRRVRRVEPHLQRVFQITGQQRLAGAQNQGAAIAQIVAGSARHAPGAPRILRRIPHGQVAA